MEYQIEILRKHLGDKVKRVHLGSSMMVRDPHSREFEKKPLKPFIVNQTNLMLERGQLRIPSRDIDETIARQMTNYVVERFSPKTGEPTYSSEDEHALDGLMFSLFGFIQEMPELAQTVEQKPNAKKIGFSHVLYTNPYDEQEAFNRDKGSSELQLSSAKSKIKRRQTNNDRLSWSGRSSMRSSEKTFRRSSW